MQQQEESKPGRLDWSKLNSQALVKLRHNFNNQRLLIQMETEDYLFSSMYHAWKHAESLAKNVQTVSQLGNALIDCWQEAMDTISAYERYPKTYEEALLINARQKRNVFLAAVEMTREEYTAIHDRYKVNGASPRKALLRAMRQQVKDDDEE